MAAATIPLTLPQAAPLSPSQLTLIKATVPVLQAHGEAITTTMYTNLITAHPSMKNIFSHTSQLTGAQPRALARAVLAYASYIDNLPALTHAVERIAQKHASLYIQPEQYDVVGEQLIGAIGQVLGDAATPEIVDAWTAAYGVLASVFVSREKQLYEADGEWGKGWRQFRIVRRASEVEKDQEAGSIVSFYLEPVDGKVPLPAFLPGQYVSVQIAAPQLGHLQSRQYSLSSWTSDEKARTQYRISVKKEHDDAAGVDGLVSNLLHESYKEGDVVELSHPHGEFHLNPKNVSKEGVPAVLISAGVGATPMMAIFHALADAGAVQRPVSWIHTSRSKATQPFAEEVVALAESIKDRAAVHVHLREGVGSEGKPRLDIAALDHEKTLFVKDGRAEYFICGPEQFMLDIRGKLADLGVDKSRVLMELFATGDVE
ncbi:globin-like protein [Coniella lustricola]|uniref:nitric oxide dioxygenase n=1 Tax=Coniella lustricola TaxID=2025994 RepID=A0A2T2ZUV4_9PEZI|nr:globin-like protein [Coniella lustricola]